MVPLPTVKLFLPYIYHMIFLSFKIIRRYRDVILIYLLMIQVEIQHSLQNMALVYEVIGLGNCEI